MTQMERLPNSIQRFCVFVLVLLGVPSWASNSLFLRPEIQNLTPDALARLSFENPKLSWFFLAERSSLDGDESAFERYSALLARSCENPQLDGNNSLVCALYFGVRSGHGSATESLENARKFFQHYKDATDFGVENVDKLYVDGRVFYKLPLVAGQNAGKSLVAFQILSRMVADHNFDYWLADIYATSRRNRTANEYRKKAQAAGSVRLQRQQVRTDSVWAKKSETSFQPGVFYSPQIGYGFLAQLDLPFIEEELSSKITASATDRAYWEANVSLLARKGVWGGKHRFAFSKFPAESIDSGDQQLVQLNLFGLGEKRFSLSVGAQYRSSQGESFFGPWVQGQAEYDEYPLKASLHQSLWITVQGGTQSLTETSVAYNLGKQSTLEARALGVLAFNTRAPFIMGWDASDPLFPRVQAGSSDVFTSLRFAQRVWLGLELSGFGLHQWSEGRFGGGAGLGWLTSQKNRVGINWVEFGGRTYFQTQSSFNL